MVALGLAPDLRKLLKLLPETRQTLLYTLTMPPELNRLAKEALVEPIRVDVGPVNKPAAGITQAVYPVNRDLKPDLLDDLLARTEVRNTVVFTRTRTACERTARQLHRHGFAAVVLDEHPSQGDRDQALEDLRRGRVQILVASDASARSLDVTGTAHVVNFDVPQTPEEYVHRLGRTGRGEPVGDAFTLMSPDEQKYVEAIERFLGRAIPRVMLPDFDYTMVPSSLRPVEEVKTARPGVASAATRIAAVVRTTPVQTPRRTPARPPVRSTSASRPTRVAARVGSRPHASKPHGTTGAKTSRNGISRRPAKPAVAARRTKPSRTSGPTRSR
jgi:ATP-dependent RNA helicase RhlE